MREEIKTISIIDGNDSNPWATAFRDFSIDFGVFGAIIVSFFSGVLIRRSYNLFLRKSDTFSLILVSLTSFCSFIIPFYSPFIVLGQSLLIFLLLHFGFKIWLEFVSYVLGEEKQDLDKLDPF